MKTHVALSVIAGWASIAIAQDTSSVVHEPTSLVEFATLARPAPSFEHRYGPASAQVIDVFLPPGRGPHPAVVLIHGGCWSAATAGREQLRHLGAALAQRGMVVWSVGYRRANEQGGGYPGTYEDVASAIDSIRNEAQTLQVNLSRIQFVGHSAGGHLALWAAARDRLPTGSALASNDPLMPSRVISIAGIGDLKAFIPAVPGICGPGIAERLTGAPSASRPDPFSDTSPAALPSPRAEILMISGVLDRLVPPYVAHDYARAMRPKSAGAVQLTNVEGAGHFDFVTPGTLAWEDLLSSIEDGTRGGGPTRGAQNEQGS